MDRNPNILSRTSARIDQCDHLDASCLKIAYGLMGVIIASKNRNTFAGRNRISVDITAHGTGQHHTGPVVICKCDRTLERPRTKYGAFCHNPPETLQRQARGHGREMVRNALHCSVCTTIIGSGDCGARHQAHIVHPR